MSEVKQAMARRPKIKKVHCPCGNKIRLFQKKATVKCFACETVFERVDGKWQAAEKIPKGTMLVQDFVKDVTTKNYLKEKGILLT